MIDINDTNSVFYKSAETLLNYGVFAQADPIPIPLPILTRVPQERTVNIIRIGHYLNMESGSVNAPLMVVSLIFLKERKLVKNLRRRSRRYS